ncbi:endonuclease/exonuclease/phosphatase family metal-dependent hydrolase [Virgibacillus natechei]|uniref:Endonuclease/exonuclease/phosphatase family metal-dependent hydrolase n=1 Tax=Virgibacillus natechei TaxID=1216297 RepID=A0ABS4IEM8_9BACI|nr:endonuclease/exonuclease/phosphatase family protein [Virgibacillus natechei]MBP1969392.1 endonuclease/exonuclease/phosphatase family metal-dependent hydrolase [Virgibacillus natechei]UZD11892.1 endonuclease/exonuclease/phosphatase family protein [Virgibacillus natechei]
MKEKGDYFVEMKVMTYNIRHGKGKDKQLDLYRIAEVIKRSDAAIIGINEIDRYYSRSLHIDQPNWLARELDMDYAFAPSLSLPPKHYSELRQYGNAILSRYPIISKKRIRLKLNHVLSKEDRYLTPLFK